MSHIRDSFILFITTADCILGSSTKLLLQKLLDLCHQSHCDEFATYFAHKETCIRCLWGNASSSAGAGSQVHVDEMDENQPSSGESPLIAG